MRILSSEELALVAFASEKEIKKNIFSLEVGQGLEILKEDWCFKSLPPNLIYYWAKKLNRKISIKIITNGWLVIRKA